MCASKQNEAVEIRLAFFLDGSKEVGQILEANGTLKTKNDEDFFGG